MSDETAVPNTEQITVWRNLLDAFSQLSAAWDVASQAQGDAESSQGPGALGMPRDLVAAFGRAGQQGAEAVAGVAAVLSGQHEGGERYTEAAEASRQAHEAWASAREEPIG